MFSLRCRICRQAVYFQRQALYLHLKQNHNSSVSQYKLDYLPPVKARTNSKKKQRADWTARDTAALHSQKDPLSVADAEVEWMNSHENADFSISEAKSEASSDEPHMNEMTESNRTSPQTFQSEHPDMDTTQEYGDEEIILTDNPSDNCTFVCGICRVAVKSLRLHVAKYHKLTTPQYKALYPEPEYQLKTYHRYG